LSVKDKIGSEEKESLQKMRYIGNTPDTPNLGKIRDKNH